MKILLPLAASPPPLTSAGKSQLGAFEFINEALQTLLRYDPNDLTPKQALDALFELKTLREK